MDALSEPLSRCTAWVPDGVTPAADANVWKPSNGLWMLLLARLASARALRP